MTLLEPEPQSKQVSERDSEVASESGMAGLLQGQHPPSSSKVGLCRSPAAGQEGRIDAYSLDTDQEGAGPS